MNIFSSTINLAIILSIGIMSRKLNVLQKNDAKVLSSYVYYFSLPALFITKISGLSITKGSSGLIIGSYFPIFIGLILLLLLLAIKAINKTKFILFSLSIAMGSNAFFGLAFFRFFQDGIHYEKAILTASSLGMLGIILSIALFEFSRDNSNLLTALKKLIKNPLIISIFIGLLLFYLGIRGSLIHNALLILGNTSGPIAIFTLGLFINDNFSLDLFKRSLPYVLFRLICLPLFLIITVLIFENILQINSANQQFLLLQTGIPSAVSLAIFAQRYQYRVKEITGIVVLTSLFSFVSLSFLYLLNMLIN
ncbi:AEC family transporter [Candidatus Margulisiibacteriota bacterium]